MRLKNVEKKMALRTAALDGSEPIASGIEFRMTDAFSAETNRAKL